MRHLDQLQQFFHWGHRGLTIHRTRRKARRGMPALGRTPSPLRLSLSPLPPPALPIPIQGGGDGLPVASMGSPAIKPLGFRPSTRRAWTAVFPLEYRKHMLSRLPQALRVPGDHGQFGLECSCALTKFIAIVLS